MPARLIVGCGYVGMRVAQRWLANGDTVFAVTRSNDRARELAMRGIVPIVWDWLIPWESQRGESLPDAFCDSQVQTVLVAVSHAAVEGVAFEDTHRHGLSHLHRFMTNHGQTSSKWIYLSTTGVYAETEPGAWVDEDSEVHPQRPGAIAALGGERWVRNHLAPHQAICLRPAGIYGPDRVPRWQALRDQTPLLVDPLSYLNLIHVDDLASIIVQVSNHTVSSQVLCVSDGAPVQRRDYYDFIAEHAELPKPLFQMPTSNQRSRSEGSKRIRNTKLIRELEYSFVFPSYREGLQAILPNTCD